MTLRFSAYSRSFSKTNLGPSLVSTKKATGMPSAINGVRLNESEMPGSKYLFRVPTFPAKRTPVALNTRMLLMGKLDGSASTK